MSYIDVGQFTINNIFGKQKIRDFELAGSNQEIGNKSKGDSSPWKSIPGRKIGQDMLSCIIQSK
ncbi:MAG TPA: hypothetical protein PLP19_22215 [bacterium]|nr:hypothetical protein [bacterium]HPN46216.1 hypothetical protein [bacterium]